MKVHWWTNNHCLFVSYLTSVAIWYGWISDTKFQKLSDKDWIWIFKNFSDMDQESINHYPLTSATHQIWARIRTGSGLKPIFAGSGLDRTAIFLKIGGSRLDRAQKIFVVLMWLFWKYQKFWSSSDFTCLLNGSVYFAIKCKTLLGLTCSSNCIHLCSLITLTSSSNVNILSGKCECLLLLCDCWLFLLSSCPLA